MRWDHETASFTLYFRGTPTNTMKLLCTCPKTHLPVCIISIFHITLIIYLTANGEPTVLRFRPENQYSTMNCEIDGKYHPQFGIICHIMLLKSVFLQLKLLWSNFRCACVFSGDMENQVEQEEKTRLINQVLELQHTLEGLKVFECTILYRTIVLVVNCCCFVL